MSFSQGSFLMLFLPITILVYYIISNKNSKGKLFRNTWLLLVSIFFYAWGEPLFVLVMLGSIVINWALCLVMKKAVGVWQKGVFSFLLLWDVGILFIFKYLSFCLKNLSYFWNVHVFELALPIGISFFSFQLLSYVIDVYRGEEPQKNIINLALYLIMFPQLVAGPIVRYTTINEQLISRQENIADIKVGIHRFVIGLEKKVLIADPLGKIVAYMFDSAAISENSVASAWLGAVAYSLEIYYDFSGYSDMAIGLGHCFGFTFEENFNYPYMAKTITDFWKRWHISLTSWFRDYIYIPLGGNRVTKKRHIYNLCVVWLCTGIWHGAN